MPSLSAEILALKALTFLAQSQDELERFVALAGIGPADLRSRADDPELLAAVIDFILADDRRLTSFCESLGLEPKAIHLARRALPGA